MTELADQIVALVERRPAITTREIVSVVGRRRADSLAELNRLERERIVCSKSTRWGARAWNVLDRFPGQTAQAPDAFKAEAGRGHEGDHDGARPEIDVDG
jgi:hypothetical protein